MGERSRTQQLALRSRDRRGRGYPRRPVRRHRHADAILAGAVAAARPRPSARNSPNWRRRRACCRTRRWSISTGWSMPATKPNTPANARRERPEDRLCRVEPRRPARCVARAVEGRRRRRAGALRAAGADRARRRRACRWRASTDGSDDLIASMISAGMDGSALRWRNTVARGSLGWALIALADPTAMRRATPRAMSARFRSAPTSRRCSRPGWPGSAGSMPASAQSYGVDVAGENSWTRAIDRAAAEGRPGEVLVLSAVGMQTHRLARRVAAGGVPRRQRAARGRAGRLGADGRGRGRDAGVTARASRSTTAR